ncbi:MAG: 50S ribosomal protein L9 [Candidatus Omnitrophica bacterium]|nr:50S ribosomal protein L9 [Candidatus Omnitrophota bacterium]MDD5027411.1 50S ribosomal protein L9 [Candidatus Omnitrophota bacterium]MDD5662309.1 50S ribosomal protein L9 [Candidatus Omnitrophota bacterium]
MEVILTKDVAKIGKAGALVKVKDGFARNLLLPKGLAVPVTPANLKKLEQERQKIAQGLEKDRQEAREIKERLDVLSLTMPAIAQDEKDLYGSITALDISNALKEEGLDLDKSRILLSEPIKSLGIYEIPVKLHPDLSAKLKVWIVKK